MLNSSPRWFEVVTKDGVKMEYGNTADSRFTNENDSAVISWMLNRVIYPDGNYIDYQYSTSDREPRLVKILYTGNIPASQSAYNEISFEYKVRQQGNFSDIRTVYIGGAAVVSRYLLDKIIVKAEGTNVKSYQLAYGHDNVNSYLKSVQESDGGGASLNPTIFKYGDTPEPSRLISTSIPSGNTINSFSGDYDGDGLPDLLSTTTVLNNGVYYVTQFKTWKRHQSTGTYSLMATQDVPQTSSYSYYGTQIQGVKQPFESDFNGDGLSDVSVFALQATPQFARLDHILHYTSNSGGTSFNSHQQPPPVKGGIDYKGIQETGDFVFQGDFDGNGLTDQVFILANALDNSDPTVFYYDNQGGTSYAYSEVMTFIPFNGQLRNAWWLANEHQVIDFNGDGRQDLVLFWDDWVEIFTFDSPTQVRSIYNSSSFPISTPNNHVRFGDFNGDGKMDVLLYDADFNSFIRGISTGAGFVQNSVSIVKHWESYDTYETNGGQVSLGDFNGDGKSDFYFRWRRNKYPTHEDIDYPYSRGVDIYYSTGDGFVNQQIDFEYVDAFSRVAQPSPVRFFPVDINGDGRTDIADRTSNAYSTDIWLINENGQDNFLVRVKDGFNNPSEWGYKKITDGGTFYSIDLGAPFYPVNVIVPVTNAVDRHKMANGIGGQRETTYTYHDARVHRAGKGFLGFTKVTSKDHAMGTLSVQQSELNSSYYVMVPKSSATHLSSDSTLINTSTLSYVLESAGPKRFWLKTNTQTTHDALSSKTTTTSLLYDAYANVTKQTITIPDVHTSVTDTEYGAYPSGIPNKPTLVTVTQTRSGETSFQTKTKLDYNALGQLTSQIDFYQQSKTVTTSYGYNKLGNQTSATISASGITTRSTGAVYDGKGRYPLQTTNELSQQSTASYDHKWGSPLTITGVDGLTTSYQYDSWGRLKKTTFPEGYHSDVTLHWDVSGQQRFYRQTVTAGQPAVKTWHDVLGREIRTETEGFGTGQWSIQTQSYDAKGNVHTSTEPHYSSESYNTTTHSYDAYNRISSVQHSAFGTTTYAYGYSGGRPTVTTTSPSGTTSKTTDAAGMLTAATDNGGTLAYTYYSHGALKSVSNGSINLTTSEYDTYGRQTKLIDVNAGTTEYNYDALGQMTWQKNTKGDETTLQYNLLGQVTQRTGVEGITSYAYGATNSSGEIKNRIKSVNGFAGTSTSYTHSTDRKPRWQPCHQLHLQHCWRYQHRILSFRPDHHQPVQ